MKILGIIFILFGTWGMGIRLGSNITCRLEEMKAMKNLILMLRAEIRYHHATLEEAFSVMGRRMREPFGAWCRSICGAMGRDDGKSFSEMYLEMLERELIPSCHFRKTDLVLLESLGESLGNGEREDQLNRLDFILEQLDRELLELGKKVGESKRLYRCFGVMSGLLIVLLLL